jgi:hypothetical protein
MEGWGSGTAVAEEGRGVRPRQCQVGGSNRGASARGGRGSGMMGRLLGHCFGPTRRNSGIYDLFKIIQTGLI